MDVKTPFLTRKTELLKSISGAYTTYYNKYTKNDITDSVSALRVLCNYHPTGDNSCEKCLDTYIKNLGDLFPCVETEDCPSNGICKNGTRCLPNSKNSCTNRGACTGVEICPVSGVCRSGTKCTPGSTNECGVCNSDNTPCSINREMLAMVNKLGGDTGILGDGDPNGVCYSSCNCEVANVVMENIIIFKEKDNIVPSDPGIKKIADDVYKDMVKKFGDEYSSAFSDQVAKIIVDISSTVTTNVNRIISSVQLIQVVDGSAYAIHEDVLVDAVMSAITQSDDSMNLISQITDQISQNIKNNVDKTLLSNFEYIWEEGKTYFIVTGLFIVGMILLVMALLIYRAVYGADR